MTAHSYETCAVTGKRIRIRKASDRSPSSSTDPAHLVVSIANPSFSKDDFHAVLRWTSRRFNSLSLTIGDSLRSHTHLAFSLDDSIDAEAAYKLSISEGDEWRDSANGLLSLYDVTTSRWDDVKALEGFSRAYSVLERAYHHDPLFAKALDCDIDKFVMRQQRRMGIFPRTSLPLVEYMLEEFAGFAAQAEQRDLVNVHVGGVPEIVRRMPTFSDMPPSLMRRRYVYLEVLGTAPSVAGKSPGSA